MKKDKKVKALDTNSCPICKKRKTAVIENWLGIDRIIFGKTNPKNILDKDQLKEFREFKNAFLLNLFEIYSDLNHISFATHKDTKHLEDYAITKAELALEHAKNILKMDEVKSMLKEEISIKLGNSPTEEQKIQLVKENLIKTALDSFLFDGVEEDLPSLNESERGRLLIGAHRKLRDTLVENNITNLTKNLAKRGSKYLDKDAKATVGAAAGALGVVNGGHLLYNKINKNSSKNK